MFVGTAIPLPLVADCDWSQRDRLIDVRWHDIHNPDYRAHRRGDQVATGSAVGGVVGVVLGAYEPIQEQEQSLRDCLSEKGYVVGAL